MWCFINLEIQDMSSKGAEYWTELFLKSFVDNVNFQHTRNYATFSRSDENNRIELLLELYSSNVTYYKSPGLQHFLQVKKTIEQNSFYNHSFLIWFSTNLEF
jgi:hypothetical protein